MKHIKTNLGHEIAVSIFTPKKAKGIVVISSATGVKQRYYADFSRYLQNKGFVVYTFDYHGIGSSGSASIKYIESSATTWGNNDLEGVLNFALSAYSDLPLTIIGHSIGGQIIGLAPSSTKADSILLVASQSGYWKLYVGFEKIKLFLFWFVILPITTKLFGYLPSRKISPMENLPKNMAKDWGNWSKKPNYLFEYIHKEQLFYAKIKATVFSYSTEADNYAPKKAVDWLAEKYKNTTRIHLIPKKLNIEKIGHFGFFKKKFESPVWEMFLKNIAFKS